MASLPHPLRNEVIGVYSDSLQVVWYTGMGLSVLIFALVFIEKEIVMRTTVEAPELQSRNTKTAGDMDVQGPANSEGSPV